MTLGSAFTTVPPELRTLSRTFAEAGYQIYLVGGAVRNAILRRPITDYDCATDARPEQVRKLFQRVIPTGIDHGTVTVLIRDFRFEVTTFRAEGTYSDGRHPDSVTFGTSIEEDLQRRDFTINGMAWDLAEGRLLDPHGGRNDIQSRLIRTIGKPRDRFGEDSLRILRAVRFSAQLQFRIDPDTAAAAAELADTVSRVSPERRRDEFQKTILAEDPVPALTTIADFGLLPALFPAMERTRGYPVNSAVLPDLHAHLASTAGMLPAVLELRLAGYLHDVGKPFCRQVSADGNEHYVGHDQVGAEIAADELRALRFPNRVVERTTRLIRHHMYGYNSTWSDAAVRRFVSRVGADLLEDLVRLRAADKGSKRGRVLAGQEFALADRAARIAGEDAALGVRDLAIDGRDLQTELGMKPGRAIGQMLDLLLEAVLDDPEMNTRDALLRLGSGLYRDRFAPGSSGSAPD